MYVLDLATKVLKEVSELDETKPPKRNSHSICATDKAAYIFGGANLDGPLNDLYEFNFETQKYRRVKLDESEVELPAIEMHTSHVYQGNKLLIVGGRAMKKGDKIEEIQFSDEIYCVDLESGKVSVLG